MSGAMNTLAKGLKWQDSSKFKISMTGPGAGIIGVPDADTLTMCCQNVQLAEITTKPIEAYIAEEWRFASSHLENYTIGITFKDYNNFTLYKGFANALQEFVRTYPADQAVNIKIETADAFNITSFLGVVEFKDCILTSVGAATLDNSAVASVSEFTVQFKASYVITG